MCMLRSCNACMRGLTLDCVNPNLQEWKRTLVGSTSDADAIVSHGLACRSWYTLHDGRCLVRALKGMSGEPTSCSRRSSVTEHGMAYGARDLGSRSANSTRGGDVRTGAHGRAVYRGKWHRWLDDQAL